MEWSHPPKATVSLAQTKGHWRRDCPLFQRNRDQLLPPKSCDRLKGLMCPEAPKKKEAVSTTGEELRVPFDVTDKPVNFLVDMGAIYSVSVTHSGPTSSETCSVVEMNRAPRFGLILS